MSNFLDWIGHMTPEQFVAMIICILFGSVFMTAAIIKICGVLESAMKAMSGNGDGQ